MNLNTHETEAWWLERMLDKSNMATSYKAYWMMSIMDIIIELDQSVISFEEVVNKMIVHAWYPSVTYKLSFGIQDRLSYLVLYLSTQYPETLNYKPDQLLKFITSSLNRDIYFVSKRKELYQMVPYRLLSPFFKEETKGITHQKKNKLITELTLCSSSSFYVIDKVNSSIRIRSNWMSYVFKNQALIKGWIQYKLILYLQARNPNVPNIPLKLKPPGSRNLTTAKKFWKEVAETQIVDDIYTGKQLDQTNYSKHGELSIDHFIPWSFVSHDEFWNLCPTFKNINSSKSDALPNLDKYLTQYTDLHYHAIQKLKLMNKRKILEDYYSLGDEQLIHYLSHDDYHIEKSMIETVIVKSIKPIHQIALNQGFDLWGGYNI